MNPVICVKIVRVNNNYCFHQSYKHEFPKMFISIKNLRIIIYISVKGEVTCFGFWGLHQGHHVC